MDPLGLEQEFDTDDHEATFDAEKSKTVFFKFSFLVKGTV